MTARSGIVLVHGGFHGSWCWDRVRPLLRFPALAVDLPGRPGGGPGAGGEHRAEPRLADYSAAIVDTVGRSGFDEVVLVGHSLAGLSLPVAAAQLAERVRHLVFVSCLIPAEGSCAVNQVLPVMRTYVRRRLVRLAAEGSGPGLELPPWLSRWSFCHDLDDADSDLVMGRLCPEPAGPLLERVPRVQLRDDLPRTYVGFRGDRVVHPFFQRRFAALAGATRVRVDGGHDGLLSNPEGLASVLNGLADEAFAVRR
jgi:pimeloyl-ACP methyl ester carboxylesterase